LNNSLFVIERARAEDAAALLDYLKIVGGETENLSFGAEGVPLDLETERDYLRSQCESADNVQYLAKVYGEIIGTASLNRKPQRMSHRGEFGISLKKAWWGCGAASALTEAVLAFAKETLLGELDIHQDVFPVLFYSVTKHSSLFVSGDCRRAYLERFSQ